MRIRMGCLGWMLWGWVVIPVFFLYLMARGVVEIFLSCMRVLDRHNRRVAARKAYERRQSAQEVRNALWNSRLPKQLVEPAVELQRDFSWPTEPQDNPNWQPRR